MTLFSFVKAKSCEWKVNILMIAGRELDFFFLVGGYERRPLLTYCSLLLYTYDDSCCGGVLYFQPNGCIVYCKKFVDLSKIRNLGILNFFLGVIHIFVLVDIAT